jgi:peptide/nickel transport system substrate-binding protein
MPNLARFLGWLFCTFLLTFTPDARGAIPEAVPAIEKLVVGTTMEVRSIDIDDYAFGILRGLMTHLGLVRLDERGEFGGDLAASWRTDDARTWTFSLKPGVVWHDGRPVASGDVRFSIDYLLEKIPVYRSHFSLIETVSTPDEATVVIRLKEPNPRFLVNMLVLKIIPRHVFETVEDPRRLTGASAAIGCGPFVFEHHDPSSGTIGFRAFDRYHRGPPHVKRVVFRLFKNLDTMMLAFRNGEIDLPYQYAAGIPPFHVPPLLKDPNIRIQLLDNPGVPAVLFFNTRKAPLDQREFRQALAMAVNYEEILNLFGAGYGSRPTGGFVTRGSPDFVETPPLSHDPDRARRMLQDLGYVDRNGDGFRERDGRVAEFELVLRADAAGNLRLAQLLQEYFRAVGVRLNLRTVDMTLFRTISDQERSHMALLTRTTPWGMMMWAGCGSGYFDARNIGWTLSDDPAFTAIVDRMNGAMDRAAYGEAAADLQRWYARELPAIPLYWEVLIQPCRTRIEGWKTTPMYGILGEESWFSIREDR